MSSSEVYVHQDAAEGLKSFDPLASVNMLRYDLERFGKVLPETRQRVCDEELSYLTEGIDRAARTEFALRREGDTLLYFDRGGWRPYTGMLITGLETAQQEALKDPRMQFLAERAAKDLLIGNQLRALQPHQRLSWYSPYPIDIERSYGRKFVSSHGFNPDRQMGFLYQAECQDDGSVVMRTQTVDRSNEDAFVAAILLAQNNPEASLDDMVPVYDEQLSLKYGGRYNAGRTDASSEENIWQAILDQRGLIEYMLNGLETIARYNVDPRQLEAYAKQHVYGVWATFKKRLDSKVLQEDATRLGTTKEMRYDIAMEVMHNFREFAREGRVLIGCGGSISVLSGENSIMNAAPENVFDSIFGNNKEAYTKLPSVIKCINCKEKVPSKQVVKVKSWCCPSCKYEVDICNGRVICQGNKKR